MTNSKSSTADYREIETIVLEKLRFKMSKIVGQFTQDSINLSVEHHAESISHHLVYEFEANVIGQKNRQEYTVEVDVPANWWEHFKYQHLPAWWQHRWPIKWKEVKRGVHFDHYALLPKWSLKMGHEIRMHTMTDEPGVNLK